MPVHSVPVLPRCRPGSKESYQMGQRITKRTLGAIQAAEREFTIWDDAVTGFGLRVRPSGAMSYVVVYRAGPGRGAAVRRYTMSERSPQKMPEREPRCFWRCSVW